jgi:hypothetical protein
MNGREPRTRGHQRKHEEREKEIEQEKDRQRLRNARRIERDRLQFRFIKVMGSLKLCSLDIHYLRYYIKQW